MGQRIGADFDATLVFLLDGYPEWYNERHGTNISVDQLTDYNVSVDWGEDIDHWAASIEEWGDTHQRYNWPRPIPDAPYYTGLLAVKNELVVLTARPEREREIVEGVLDLHFPNTFLDVYMRANDVHVLGMDKGEEAEYLGLDWLVDDHFENYDSAVARNIRAILFGKYGWNEQHRNGRVHADNWEEVNGIIIPQAA